MIRSAWIDRVFIQFLQRNVVEHGFVRCRQKNSWRSAVLQGLNPASCTKTPAITRLQARKSCRGIGGCQIVATGLAEGKKFLADFSAHNMRAKIIRTGIATAVAVKASQW